jgi:hypothetical protein
VRGVNMSGAARSGGVADPMIHFLSLWTPLITAPEAVAGRFLASFSLGTWMDRCGRPSRCGQPTSLSCDAPPSLKIA